MGLGKTIQSITFLYEIYMKGIEGPFLVIAPLSTIPNWEREFRTWTELNAVVYHGSQASRKTIQAYEMYYRDAQVKKKKKKDTDLEKTCPLYNTAQGGNRSQKTQCFTITERLIKVGTGTFISGS